MATLYKTPGVYTEEIPKFPPSIAPVETAIPAFIGYTQKADKARPGDLINIPTKIGSIAEYELYFGEGYTPNVIEVKIDDNKNFKSASIANTFYMYDSMRLFYTNGGGDCYIVSTGTYDAAGKVVDDFTGTEKGINALERVDEPTIIVFPDNSLLTTGTDFYTVYKAALSQCAALKDRVGLFHVKEDDPKGDDNFRSGIGINDLKYGMTYSPWLEINFPKNITYRGFKDVIYKGSTNFDLSDLTDDAAIKTLLTEYKQAIADVDKIGTATTSVAAPAKTLRDRFTELDGAYLLNKIPGNFQKIVDFMFGIARKLDELAGTTSGALTNAEYQADLKELIHSTLKGYYETLIGYDKELTAKVTTAPAYVKQYDVAPKPSEAKWEDIFGVVDSTKVPAASNIIPASAAGNTDKMDSVLPKLRALFDLINSAWLDGVINTGHTLENTKHDALKSSFPLYKSILTGIANTSTTVPPSGAVAGIYAYVDRTRGVWKAPANVSISGIIGPGVTFKASELEALNVDPNSGKSINAIRNFTGKGTLVFGARTLAGNDNEWRYVNVRRFFNFVEESCKKATEQFVFEPNDANTWVRVQAMIENFLTTLWRQGALQGVKPEHAFYVAVGLGKTMTALDILEGRMIIEIGMAAVRPAEFIILRFSHKMAES
ncbi:MAG: phage tail sheath C-terminal domain-containing protein [Smithella sp.]